MPSYPGDHLFFFFSGIPTSVPRGGVKESKSLLTVTHPRTSQVCQDRQKTHQDSGPVLGPARPFVAVALVIALRCGDKPEQGLPGPRLVPWCRHTWRGTWPGMCGRSDVHPLCSVDLSLATPGVLSLQPSLGPHQGRSRRAELSLGLKPGLL